MPFKRGEVVLVLFPDSNLMDSVIMTDNLATIREIEIDRVIGALPDMAELNDALRHTLGL